MHPELLADLLELRDQLLSQRQVIERKLESLDAILKDYKGESSKAEVKDIRSTLRLEPKQRRVRGVLAAATKAIEQLPEPFDKNQLRAKLVELDEGFAHKKITDSSIRNALRLLTQRGVIRVKREATAKSRATYIKAA